MLHRTGGAQDCGVAWVMEDLRYWGLHERRGELPDLVVVLRAMNLLLLDSRTATPGQYKDELLVAGQCTYVTPTAQPPGETTTREKHF